MMKNFFPFSIFPLLIGILLFSTSCTFHRLDIQTQYFTHENLASYHVGTPDPQLDHPAIGERLLIQWSLPSQQFETDKTVLYLTVRFKNRHEEKREIYLAKSKGITLYVLKNEEFLNSGGILTYFAEIRNSSTTLATWKHPLWCPLIILNPPK